MFCRPACPAKTPRRENCEFFSDPQDALRRGFRACLRCLPLKPVPATPAWMAPLLESRARGGSAALRRRVVVKLDIHPATARRFFRRSLDTNWQSIVRAQRVELALEALRIGATMSAALTASGFQSESGLRKACEELFEATPASAAQRGMRPLAARWIASPLGGLLAIAADEGLCLLEFTDRRMLLSNVRRVRTRLKRPIVPATHAYLDQVERELAEYFAGRRQTFDTPLHPLGTPFQQAVWRELLAIPSGQTRSYLQVARAVGSGESVRAVAAANGQNCLAILIPCHRVIGSNGKLVGYGGGLWRKQRLLALEGVALAL